LVRAPDFDLVFTVKQVLVFGHSHQKALNFQEVLVLLVNDFSEVVKYMVKRLVALYPFVACGCHIPSAPFLFFPLLNLEHQICKPRSTNAGAAKSTCIL
jgi:hypothetical protein